MRFYTIISLLKKAALLIDSRCWLDLIILKLISTIQEKQLYKIPSWKAYFHQLIGLTSAFVLRQCLDWRDWLTDLTYKTAEVTQLFISVQLEAVTFVRQIRLESGKLQLEIYVNLI